MEKKYRAYLAENANKTSIAAALTDGFHKRLPVMLLPDHCNLYDRSHVNTVAIVIAAPAELVDGYPYEPDHPETDPCPGQIIGFIEEGEMPEPIYTPTNPNLNLPALILEDGQFFVSIPKHLSPKKK